MGELWLGVLLSIPVGIVINLVSPFLSKGLDRRNEKSARKRAARDSDFQAEAARLARDRPALYVYLLEALIRVAYVGALFGAHPERPSSSGNCTSP